jgi:hypothetical protein
MRRTAGYLTDKIGKTDRKQTQKNLIEYYFIGKFKQALKLFFDKMHTFAYDKTAIKQKYGKRIDLYK